METRDTAQALTALELARIIHDGSSRNPGVAQRCTHCTRRAMGTRRGAAKNRGVLEQYVEGLSGEPARPPACHSSRMQAGRSRESRVPVAL